jgi:hypothetical protein
MRDWRPPNANAGILGSELRTDEPTPRRSWADLRCCRQRLERRDAGLKGLRDRALLLLGFAGAFRRSELVALDVSDIEETPEWDENHDPTQQDRSGRCWPKHCHSVRQDRLSRRRAQRVDRRWRHSIRRNISQRQQARPRWRAAERSERIRHRQGTCRAATPRSGPIRRAFIARGFPDQSPAWRIASPTPRRSWADR